MQSFSRGIVLGGCDRTTWFGSDSCRWYLREHSTAQQQYRGCPSTRMMFLSVPQIKWWSRLWRRLFSSKSLTSEIIIGEGAHSSSGSRRELPAFDSRHYGTVLAIGPTCGDTAMSLPEAGLNRLHLRECGRYSFLDSPLGLDQAHDITLEGGSLLPAPAAALARVLVEMPYLRVHSVPCG